MTDDTPALATVTLSFKTTAREQARVLGLVLRSRWPWLLLIVAFVAVPCILGLRFLLDPDSFWAGLALLVLAAASALYWTYLMPLICIRSARRGMSEPDGPFTWHLADSGCQIEGPNTSITLTWKSIFRVRETPEFLLFFLGMNSAQFIPRRAVSDDQLAHIRILLTRVGLQP